MEYGSLFFPSSRSIVGHRRVHVDRTHVEWNSGTFLSTESVRPTVRTGSLRIPFSFSNLNFNP